MMKAKSMMIASLLAGGIASASIIVPSGINGTHDTATSSEFELTGAAQFVNPNDTTSGTVINYYAGSLHADNSAMGNGFLFSFVQASPESKALSIGKYEWGSNWSYWFNGATSGSGTGLGSALTTDIDFAIKIENKNWNAAGVSLFLGDNATATTEGTADLTFDITAADFSKIIIGPTSGASGSVTVSNFSAGDEWVAAIPEPATITLFGLSAGLALLLRKLKV